MIRSVKRKIDKTTGLPQAYHPAMPKAQQWRLTYYSGRMSICRAHNVGSLARAASYDRALCNNCNSRTNDGRWVEKVFKFWMDDALADDADAASWNGSTAGRICINPYFPLVTCAGFLMLRKRKVHPECAIIIYFEISLQTIRPLFNTAPVDQLSILSSFYFLPSSTFWIILINH